MRRIDRLDWLTLNWNKAWPELDITPWMIWGRITRLNELFLSAISKPLKKHGLNFKEYETLAALVLTGPPYEANPNQISKSNLLTSGGMTNLLSRMEKDGLVKRKPDPDDKRGVRIQLTDQGMETFRAVTLEENQVEHQLLEAMSLEERETMATMLRKLLSAIDPVDLPAEARTHGVKSQFQKIDPKP